MHFINKIAGAHVKNLHFLNPVLLINKIEQRNSLSVRFLDLFPTLKALSTMEKLKLGGSCLVISHRKLKLCRERRAISTGGDVLIRIMTM